MEHLSELHMQPLGDSALVVRLAKEVSEEAHDDVMNFIQAIEKDPFTGFLEAVPTYTNVSIFYDPVKVYHTYGNQSTVFETVCTIVKEYTIEKNASSKESCTVVEIPVVYGGEFGPDLPYVAQLNDMTEEEVIHMHSARDYLVYMIGFAPGFPFLGGMDERISAPRKASPRAATPAGSVGIAGMQTGMYPLESPGGWQIIGRSPVELFVPESHPPTLIQPGDRLRFVPINQEEYVSRIGGSVHVHTD